VGAGDYVVHEAMELLAFTKDITIYTNGNELQVSEKFVEAAKRFRISKNPYTRLTEASFSKKSFSKTVPARILTVCL